MDKTMIDDIHNPSSNENPKHLYTHLLFLYANIGTNYLSV